MPPRVVLVTGVAGYIGGRLAARLAEDPGISRVIGVDTELPGSSARLGRTEFMRADIRNPSIAKVLRNTQPDTVVHTSVDARVGAAGGRAAAKETNVIGTMQLLAGCQSSESITNFVLRSSGAVYGSSAKDPARFSEDMQGRRPPAEGFGRDMLEVEEYVRGFSRRRPDVEVSILRLGDLLGPQARSVLGDYLRQPAVGTVLGFDPRVQFLHLADAVAALAHAVGFRTPGTFNIAGDGRLLLSQAIRRAGGIPVPLPGRAGVVLRGGLGRIGVATYPRSLLSYLSYGRVLDTSRSRRVLGFTPRWDTPQTLDDFVRSHDLTTMLSPQVLAGAEAGLLRGVAGLRAAMGATRGHGGET